MEHTARDDFEELGYEFDGENEKFLSYKKTIGKNTYYIGFNKLNKSVTYGFMGPVVISELEIRAIYNQMNELGWY